MPDSEPTPKPPGALHNWIVTLAIVFMSFFGILLALICIYAMPDQTVRPVAGAVFYLCSASVIIIFLLLRWKKEMAITTALTLNPDGDKKTVIIKESISDKIIKWITLLYVFFFVLMGITIALICVYALPDNTVQPKTGLFYFLSGSMAIASFVFVVWKNRSWENKKT